MSRLTFMTCVGVCWLLAAPLSAQTPNTANLGLVGNRFKPLTWEEMTPEQKTMATNLLNGPRRGMGGPFNVLLRSPEMGDQAAEFGEQTRFRSSLPPKLTELAIIMTARHWTSQFQWYAHKRAALQAGLNPSVADDIANGKRPASMQQDEEIVYNFCGELLGKKQVSDATFRTMKDRFGERGVVDLIGVMAWHQLVSMLLNVDGYPLPEGVQPELK